MDKELQEKLYEDFPILYTQHTWSIRESCMPWGFDTGSGWEPIIRKLSEKIEKFNQELVARDPLAQTIQAVQVKEKFGSLRTYMNYEPEEIQPWLKEAYEASTVTCDVCGKPGTLGGKYWLSTRCEEHTKQGD